MSSDSLNMRGGDAEFASTLARGLTPLAAFRHGDDVLGNAELARRTGLTRPMVARLTATLVELGYLHRQPDGGGYRLGARLLTVAHLLLGRLRVRQAARPVLTELADYVRGAVSIATIDRLDAVFVETAPSAESYPLSPDIGTTVPLLQTAAGRALLSLLEPGALSTTLASFAAERPLLWARLHASAEAEVRRARTQGYALSLGDFRPEVHAVARADGRTVTRRNP
jgi:DNA-binding IclR family transcriptional regulator